MSKTKEAPSFTYALSLKEWLDSERSYPQKLRGKFQSYMKCLFSEMTGLKGLHPTIDKPQSSGVKKAIPPQTRQHYITLKCSLDVIDKLYRDVCVFISHTECVEMMWREQARDKGKLCGVLPIVDASSRFAFTESLSKHFHLWVEILKKYFEFTPFIDETNGHVMLVRDTMLGLLPSNFKLMTASTIVAVVPVSTLADAIPTSPSKDVTLPEDDDEVSKLKRDVAALKAENDGLRAKINAASMILNTMKGR